MWENNEDWIKQLDTVILEACGLSHILAAEPTYVELLSKLEGLHYKEVEFSLFRKTIFESIGLLQRMLK